MKIALIGYGKMGHAIEGVALERGHQVVARIDAGDSWEAAKACDVALEFTSPQTAVGNIERALDMGIPLVVGTTGWYDHIERMRNLCHEVEGALFVDSNFSIGMNIMFALNRKLAALMATHPEYQVDIREIHHIHKLDAPSGTAITLAGQIEQERSGRVPIESVREGEVPGTHVVRYSSSIDTLTLSHEAHSRKGFAVGAVLAAEFLHGRKGYYTMKDLLQG